MLTDVTCIIPARGGSKGIPDKNLQIVGGISLIERSVLLAQKVTVDVWVSTDDKRIADIAFNAGAGIVDRPEMLAGDQSTSETALLHACDYLENLNAVGHPGLHKTLLFLQCTSPFTTVDDIARCVRRVQNGEFQSAFSATKFDGVIWQNNNGTAETINSYQPIRFARQTRIKVQYLETGAAYVMDTDHFRRERTRFCGRISPCVVKTPRFEIDTPEDLELARRLINHEVLLH